MMPFSVTLIVLSGPHPTSGSAQEDLPRGALPPEAQPLPVVPSCLQGFAPVPVLQIPLHCLAQAVLEVARGRPTELAADLGRVDRIPPIVPRPIGDEGLEGPVGRPRRLELVENIAHAIDDLEVRPLVA